MLSLRKTIEWTLGGRPFKLQCLADTGTLTGPDGRSLTLSRAEWVAVGEVLRDAFIGRAAVAPPATEPERPAEAEQADRPPNSGKPWTSDLDEALRAGWTDGNDAHSLATKFGRSTGSIVSRLVHLGLITFRDDPMITGPRREG